MGYLYFQWDFNHSPPSKQSGKIAHPVHLSRNLFPLLLIFSDEKVIRNFVGSYLYAFS